MGNNLGRIIVGLVKYPSYPKCTSSLLSPVSSLRLDVQCLVKSQSKSVQRKLYVRITVAAKNIQLQLHNI